MSEMPWQLKMFEKSHKKKQKIKSLAGSFRDVVHKDCLLVTCGDNNGAMNYRIREWGGEWVWAEFESTNIEEIEELLQEPVHRLDLSTCKLPFPEASFDCVLTIDCHEHMKAPVLFNGELWRVTRPGGKVVVTAPSGDKRKLAARIKRWVGMSAKEYGHVVDGYGAAELGGMLEEVGFSVSATSSYAKFFTEMVELSINYAYVKILAKRSNVRVEEGVIAPITKERMGAVGRAYKLYSLIHPVFWAIAKLDALLFFTTGHAVVVEAVKGR